MPFVSPPWSGSRERVRAKYAGTWRFLSFRRLIRPQTRGLSGTKKQKQRPSGSGPSKVTTVRPLIFATCVHSYNRTAGGEAILSYGGFQINGIRFAQSIVIDQLNMLSWHYIGIKERNNSPHHRSSRELQSDGRSEMSGKLEEHDTLHKFYKKMCIIALSWVFSA